MNKRLESIKSLEISGSEISYEISPKELLRLNSESQKRGRN